MNKKEATARIKINKLLEEAGWRFFDSPEGKANIALEQNTKLNQKTLDEVGNDFEKQSNGFIDFLLLDIDGSPLAILEAKSEKKHPLDGKEQARKYARSLNCRFVILSNGNLHYFWDIDLGNPEIISSFPTQESLSTYTEFKPNKTKLVNEVIERDYIALTQMPNYQKNASWQNDKETFIEENKLRFLRYYQENAIKALQKSVEAGNNRFLLEMATGTGKTLTASAIIKLFLRTDNAKRVLLLVDRLELEKQAEKDFKNYLKNDFRTVIYKDHRHDWRNAKIVVTTVQSLQKNDHYKEYFAPNDFQLVISDEAHRSINGEAKAVFEYFHGYKLGLTATPKDYLKNFSEDDSLDRKKELEIRALKDTYSIFGCESGEPTFRYSLLDGVRDNFLINPIVVDARTDITTKLLSEEGYSVQNYSEDEESTPEEQIFTTTDYEKKFFSEGTNEIFCKTFLEHALKDPISGEIGKSIIFAVSQKHACKIAQILNEMANTMFPNKYQSDFAIQVTSNVPDAQIMTINFANNNLSGTENFKPDYKTCKTRVCVTVGMMTTGYDCPDILNLGLMRPIFSPSDFIQIKGRGTRKHNFSNELTIKATREEYKDCQKKGFKLFDFFANCEYFEEKFNYDEVLKLPTGKAEKMAYAFDLETQTKADGKGYEFHGEDDIASMEETQIGKDGMKIDRMFFDRFREQAESDDTLRENVNNGEWQKAEDYLNEHIFNKPNDYFTMEKLRKALDAERHTTIKDILRKIFGHITQLPSRDDIANEKFEAFILKYNLQNTPSLEAIRYFFKSYLMDNDFRQIIENNKLQELYSNAGFGIKDYKAVPLEWRKKIPDYIKDYVSLNQFM